MVGMHERDMTKVVPDFDQQTDQRLSMELRTVDEVESANELNKMVPFSQEKSDGRLALADTLPSDREFAEEKRARNVKECGVGETTRL